MRLLEDEDTRRRMGEAGRKRVNPAFGVEAMVSKIESIYEELIAKKIKKMTKVMQR